MLKCMSTKKVFAFILCICLLTFSFVNLSIISVTAEDPPQLPSPVFLSPSTGDIQGFEVPGEGVPISWEPVQDASYYMMSLQDLQTEQSLNMTTTPYVWGDFSDLYNLGDTTSTTIPNEYLTAGHNYTITVVAFGSGYPGGSSVDFFAYEVPHLGDPVFLSPSTGDIQGFEVPGEGVPISWEPVQDTSYYMMCLQDLQTGQSLNMATTPYVWGDFSDLYNIGDTTSTTIPNEYLTACHNYTITVVAFGNGYPGSSSVDFYAYEVPHLGDPIFLSPSTVDIQGFEVPGEGVPISWEPVQYASYYKMSLQDLQTGQSLNMTTTPYVWGDFSDLYDLGDTTSTTIPNEYLTAGHNYTITVVAFGSGYPGSSSVDFYAYEVPHLGDPVFLSPSTGDIQGFEVQGEGVPISWEPVQNASYYKMSLQDLQTGQHLNMTTTPYVWGDFSDLYDLGDTTSVTIPIEYLTAGHNYTITVVAFGSGYPGSSSVDFFAYNNLYEAENLVINYRSDTHTVTNYTYASGGKYDLLNANSANDCIEYKVNVQHTGTYNMKVRVMKYNNTGTYQASINGVNQGLAFDGYLVSHPYSDFDLGNVTFNSTGDQLIRFTCTGKNASATGYKLPLDFIQLTYVN